MRLAIVLLVAACGSGADTKAPPSNDAAPGGGPEALPPPRCGIDPRCNQCASCALADSLCFGPQPRFTANIGDCVTTAVTGTLTMMAGSDAFTADAVAAAVVEDGVVIEGHAQATQTIDLFVPSTPGTYSCATSQVIMQLHYIDAAGAIFDNRIVSGRPDCTIDVTSVGAVGQRIEGSFSATVQGATSVVLSNGSFSVERVAYP